MRFGLIALFIASVAHAQPVILAADPAPSPDGKLVAFAWSGDLWTVSSAGGQASRLTVHPADDRKPRFSPDGREIAFMSDRSGSWQVYVMPASGGAPEAVTFHSEGSTLLDWYPDGSALLVSSVSDSSWPDPRRFWRVMRQGSAAPEMVFDATGDEGQVAPEGKRLAFRREGGSWWRKGYRGAASGQLWLFEEGRFRKLLALDTEARSPVWRADGAALWYVGAEDGTANLRELDLATGATRALTRFQDDGVFAPAASRDGSLVVFRRLFDLWTLAPGGEPKKLAVTVSADEARAPVERRGLTAADAASFTSDGLEVAFTAGGDVWVMDSVLREPRRVTDTPEEERDPAFTKDGAALLFVSDAGGRPDLWRAERRDATRYWWRNEEFELKKLTDDEERESDLRPSPDGSRVAFVKGLGDLWTMTAEGKDARRIIASWNEPEYDWSPDGRWIVYVVSDNDFNADVWIRPADGSGEAVNVSKHPDNEATPVWSPDGKLIAFTGEREEETDIFYVWLRKEDDEKAKRDRTLDEALEKMKKVRKGEEGENKEERRKPWQRGGGKGKPAASVVIDFEDIHERVRRVPFPGASETGLFWKHDSKQLAFGASVEGTSRTYTVEFPGGEKPKQLVARSGAGARWIDEGDQILWVSDGVPGSWAKGDWTPWTFTARQEVDVVARHRAAFVAAWRAMRDRWYDERMNNRDWDEIRRKYEDAAAAATDARALSEVVHMMLGELNGSHLGFRWTLPGWKPPDQWNHVTPHFGIRWDPAHRGRGLRVRDVLPGSPADRAASRVLPGDLVLAIDGVPVEGGEDLARRFSGPPDRDWRLSIQREERGVTTRKWRWSEVRVVTLRPIGWGEVLNLLYRKRVKDSRARVERQSNGALGYLHIRGMDWPSFQTFQQELYSVGVGRDGLVIDVRENGGGFTADHLLTILTQPAHAITVPRGGGAGYPQDRRVYATWDKPIIVLCNQNSFSNAEIFSHAIKVLKRGKVVGVATAGGVISTGGTRILDVGFLRIPMRGWFGIESGEDMELNGCVPDIVLWPEPGDLAAGKDVQLDKAVEVLLEDVRAWKARPQPKLKKASER